MIVRHFTVHVKGPNHVSNPIAGTECSLAASLDAIAVEVLLLRGLVSFSKPGYHGPRPTGSMGPRPNAGKISSRSSRSSIDPTAKGSGGLVISWTGVTGSLGAL